MYFMFEIIELGTVYFRGTEPTLTPFYLYQRASRGSSSDSIDENMSINYVTNDGKGGGFKAEHCLQLTNHETSHNCYKCIYNLINRNKETGNAGKWYIL